MLPLKHWPAFTVYVIGFLTSTCYVAVLQYNAGLWRWPMAGVLIIAVWGFLFYWFLSPHWRELNERAISGPEERGICHDDGNPSN